MEKECDREIKSESGGEGDKECEWGRGREEEKRRREIASKRERKCGKFTREREDLCPRESLIER